MTTGEMIMLELKIRSLNDFIFVQKAIYNLINLNKAYKKMINNMDDENPFSQTGKGVNE